MAKVTLIKIREKYWINFELSELNFIHVSNQKFMNVLQSPFLVAGILILNLVLNLWTDLFSPFFA